MNTNERFNELLNSCQNPQAVYDALLILAKTGVLERLRKEYMEREDQT